MSAHDSVDEIKRTVELLFPTNTHNLYIQQIIRVQTRLLIYTFMAGGVKIRAQRKASNEFLPTNDIFSEGKTQECVLEKSKNNDTLDGVQCYPDDIVISSHYS